MRCLILIALCVSVTLAVELNRYLPVAFRAKAPVSLQLGPSGALRAKRDIRMHPMDDPDQCLANCTYDMHDGLQDLNDTDSEEQKMTALCKTVEPVEACYKSCPDSEFRNLLLDFLPLMKQPCILGTDHVGDLKKALDCLNGTSDAVSAKCDSVCNGSFAGDLRMESRVILNVDPAFVIYDDDKLENRDVFKATCNFLKCQQQCGDPIAKEQCGQQALDVDHKMTSSIFGSVIQLYKDLDGLDGDVKECKDLL